MKRCKKPSSMKILVILVGLLATIYVADLLVQRTKSIVLQIFVANDDQNTFEAKKIEAELADVFSIGNHERIIVDDSLYVVFDSSDPYVESSLAKIYAYMAAKELDVLIAPLAVVQHYTQGLPMLDYPTLLKDEPELLQHLQPYLIRTTSADGQKNEYLLDLTQSRYSSSDAMYMAIPSSAPHLHAITNLLKYVFPL
ncbi:hypothetical protein SpiBuddy_1427 [Sphaerochaeta globosa str. Buddy]|uniref:Uncharacterized protein n=2 Tax=Sphaerochaeta TaxID=399320 RepID=F0RZ45_SPHGB|nr:hypothetical protein SpiBuddy_1427 [Sphaerochaeta globosa str. Buddy]